jgi:hypothetical protein
MHPIVIQELAKERMADPYRQAGHPRLALAAAIQGNQRARASIREPRKPRGRGVLLYPWDCEPSRDRGQPRRSGESLPLAGVAESPVWPDRLGSLR